LRFLSYASGALLPFLNDDELKTDIGMTSSIHRNALLRAIGAITSGEGGA
jgi:hypothetical protein